MTEDSIALSHLPKLCAHRLTSHEFSWELSLKELLKATHLGWTFSHLGKNEAYPNLCVNEIRSLDTMVVGKKRMHCESGKNSLVEIFGTSKLQSKDVPLFLCSVIYSFIY